MLLNRKGIIPAFAVILTILTILISVGYSALNQNLSVSGEAFLRAKDNIRISRIELSDAANDGYETYNPEYSKRTTKMYTTLPKDDSSVTYTVKVTNSTGIRYKVGSIDVTSTNSNVSCTPSIEVNTILEDGITEFTVTANYENGMSQDTNLNACDIKYEFVPLDATPPTLAVQLVSDNGNTKTIKITAIDEAEGSGLSPDNIYKYYLSTSETELLGGIWKEYVNSTEFEISGDIEARYLWIYPVRDRAGNISGGNSSVEPYSVGKYIFIDDVPTLYNAIAKEALTDGVAKLYTGKHNDAYDESGTKKIFHFYGANSNAATSVLNKNNVLFAGFCWQMIRTTDTGGVKLIYNGKLKDESETIPINESEYNVTSNDTGYPYTYDSSTKTWTSTMKTHSSSGTIIFTIKTAGDYYLNYTVSSEARYDKATFYKNGTQIGQYSGTATGRIKLGSLLTTDEIKVIYSKNSVGSSGSDNVIFSVSKPIGEVKYICNNSGTAQQIKTSAFNENSDSPAYVGYMHNAVYSYKSKSMSSTDVYKYANSFTYSNGTYKLSSDAVSIDVTNGTEYIKLNDAHYTCFNTTGECSTIYYIYYFISGGYTYYIELKDGKSVENALNEMLSADNVNLRNSTIKDTVDTWYASNMTDYTKYLEDTVFCNDRSISDYGGWNPNGGILSNALTFKSDSLNNDLYCTNVTDRFSVGNEKAKLTYPIGLMSTPEMRLLGNESILKTGKWYWLDSPCIFGGYFAREWLVDSNIGVNHHLVDRAYGVRPAVSLVSGTRYVSGTGSTTDPYIVDLNAPTVTQETLIDGEREKTIRITASDDYGLSSENKYQYYLSTSETELVGGEWKDYTSREIFTLAGENETKYLWVYPVMDKAGNINDGKTNVNTPYMLIPLTFKDKLYLYNVLQKEYASGRGLAKLYTGQHNDTYNEIGTQNIYHFYGADNTAATNVLTKNNVIFAGFCWQMIRTTDTGGVKLIYNGVPKETKGKKVCTNSGTEQQIGELAFNSNYNSLAYVGYMYNTVYTYKVKSMSSSDVYKYAKSFTYSNGTYKLSSDAISIDVTNSTDKTNLNNAHYTCFNETGECSTIYYIYYVSGTHLYYIELNNGTTVEKALEEMLSADNVNQTNSTIKTTIDTWYENNMTSYTKYLEDTVFCNDRSIYSYNGWNPDGGSVTNYLQFKNYNVVSDLYCTNETDRFSVGNSKAKLIYPVGLMTTPEMKLLEYNSIRATRQLYWLASPSVFYYYGAVVRIVHGIGSVYSHDDVSSTDGARPSVSLAPGTQYVAGTGSATDPYVILTN